MACRTSSVSSSGYAINTSAIETACAKHRQDDTHCDSHSPDCRLPQTQVRFYGDTIQFIHDMPSCWISIQDLTSVSNGLQGCECHFDRREKFMLPQFMNITGHKGKQWLGKISSLRSVEMTAFQTLPTAMSWEL